MLPYKKPLTGQLLLVSCVQRPDVVCLLFPVLHRRVRTQRLHRRVPRLPEGKTRVDHLPVSRHVRHVSAGPAHGHKGNDWFILLFVVTIIINHNHFLKGHALKN